MLLPIRLADFACLTSVLVKTWGWPLETVRVLTSSGDRQSPPVRTCGWRQRPRAQPQLHPSYCPRCCRAEAAGSPERVPKFTPRAERCAGVPSGWAVRTTFPAPLGHILGRILTRKKEKLGKSGARPIFVARVRRKGSVCVGARRRHCAGVGWAVVWWRCRLWKVGGLLEPLCS